MSSQVLAPQMPRERQKPGLWFLAAVVHASVGHEYEAQHGCTEEGLESAGGCSKEDDHTQRAHMQAHTPCCHGEAICLR